MPFTSLAGVYDNGGYGQSEFCYVSSAYPTESKSCRELNANLSTILPEAVETGVPTFIARWDSPWASHIKLSHFDENYFNVSSLQSVVSFRLSCTLALIVMNNRAFQPNTGQESEPFWTRTTQGPGVNAEFVINENHIGLGFTGIWGAAIGVPDLQGQTVQDRAEVWFVKV